MTATMDTILSRLAEMPLRERYVKLCEIQVLTVHNIAVNEGRDPQAAVAAEVARLKPIMEELTKPFIPESGGVGKAGL